MAFPHLCGELRSCGWKMSSHEQDGGTVRCSSLAKVIFSFGKANSHVSVVFEGHITVLRSRSLFRLEQELQLP